MADDIDKEVESIASFDSHTGEPNYSFGDKKKTEKKEKAEEPNLKPEVEAVTEYNAEKSEGREYEKGERERGLAGVKSYYKDTPEIVEMRKEREKGWVEAGTWSKGNAITDVANKTAYAATHPVESAIDFKGGASLAKLKWEASKYGITPEEFERYRRGEPMAYRDKKGNVKLQPRTLNDVKLMIDQGKAREIDRKRAEANVKVAQAQEKAILAQAEQRYAKAEQITNPATVPSGGRRLVQFGWKEGSFGQEPTYVNAAGLHGQIRNQFIPGKASGVSSTLANSRLEIAKMKSRVLSGASGNMNAVQAMQPNSRGYGVPSVINKLAGSHSNSISKLAPYGQPKMGPSILDKLSANKRRPWR